MNAIRRQAPVATDTTVTFEQEPQRVLRQDAVDLEKVAVLVKRSGLLVLGMSTSCSVTMYPQAPTAPVTAFVDVAVIPMDQERVLAHQTVVVRGDRIAAIGPTKRTAVPTGAVRVNGQSKYLLPGLADMHAHINHHREDLLWFHLANGVTTIREMMGAPEVLALRASVERGEVLGPRIYTVGINSGCPEGQPLLTCLKAMKAAGDLMVKIYWDSPMRFDSLVTLAREVHLLVGGHVSPFVGLERSLQVPYASIEHLWGYFDALAETGHHLLFLDLLASYSGAPSRRDTLLALLDTARWMRPEWRPARHKLDAIVAATRRAGTWNAPTLTVMEELGNCWTMRADTSPGIRLFRAMIRVNLSLVEALQAGGAGLLLSTDMSRPSGFSVHRELELLVGAAGLTPYQALSTGTREAARYLGTLDSTGTVAVGKRADLVLLDGNPLKDIRYTAGPAGVMVGGHWLPRALLDARLDSILAGKEGDEWENVRRLRRAAARHQGTPLYVWQDSTPPPPAGAAGDICAHLRSIGPAALGGRGRR